MSANVVYEGHAKVARYQVQTGSHARQSWSCMGGSFTSIEAAKEAAAHYEDKGYDTRICLVSVGVSK